MPELRKDPILGRWVIISTERGKRPHDFVMEKPHKDSKFCPFCYGNESSTPPEIYAIREATTTQNSPGWRVRVVSNKYPALRIEAEFNRTGIGMYDMMNGIGAHEVIIETPNHEASIGTMTVDEVDLVLTAYKIRMTDLLRDNRFQYILIFKNCGEAAGATLEHPHSQIIATPIVPKRVVEEINGANTYYDFRERCVFCDIIRQEMSDKVRMILETEHFLSFAPFAARFPFETWVMPKKHHSSFELIDETMQRDLSLILRDTISRMNTILDFPPYNWILHTAPAHQTEMYQYHWHFEIMPKLSKVAGFEWGSGFYINPTPPEDAAADMRLENI
jgi:UDPglucose--hexose-1-phosphate uridylyltransferase